MTEPERAALPPRLRWGIWIFHPLGLRSDRGSGLTTSIAYDTIQGMDIISTTDHGVWRGRRTWTVVIDGETGRAQVSAIDVATEADAIAQAKETYANRPVISDEDRAAMRATNEALQRGLS